MKEFSVLTYLVGLCVSKWPHTKFLVVETWVDAIFHFLVHQYQKHVLSFLEQTLQL